MRCTPTGVPSRDVVRHGTASLCGGSVRRTIELGQLRQLLLQLDLGSLRNSYSYFMSDNPILCLGLCNIGPVERAVKFGPKVNQRSSKSYQATLVDVWGIPL